MAARVGVEPTTLRLKVIDSTNVPPRPTVVMCLPYSSVVYGPAMCERLHSWNNSNGFHWFKLQNVNILIVM